MYWTLDMSSAISRDGIRCLVPLPRRLTSWLLPFEPFQVTLWLGICGCLMLELFSLLLTRKFVYGVDKKISWRSSFDFGLTSTLKLFVSQGTKYVIKSTSVRIVLLSCYMIDIIITSVYSGGLASILTIPAFEEPADTTDRLTEQKLPWGATSTAWIGTLQKTENEQLIEVLDLFHVYSGDELRQKSLTERLGIAIERLQHGHFAVPSYIDQEMVNIMKLMTTDLYFEYTVAFTSRPWALLEKFNNLCLMVQSSGISQFWEWKVVADHLDLKMQRQIESSAYTNFDKAGPVKLGLKNFAGIIVVWCIGIVISVIVFIAEFFFPTLSS